MSLLSATSRSSSVFQAISRSGRVCLSPRLQTCWALGCCNATSGFCKHAHYQPTAWWSSTHRPAAKPSANSAVTTADDDRDSPMAKSPSQPPAVLRGTSVSDMWADLSPDEVQERVSLAAGGYVGVRRVVRLLEHWDNAKRIVDAAIDANAQMVNLRVSIMRWVSRQRDLERRSPCLVYYFCARISILKPGPPMLPHAASSADSCGGEDLLR